MKKSFLASLALLLVMSLPVQAQSCRQSSGMKKAKRIVDQCLQVSPASRPPCHVENPCDLMIDEIKRGCSQFAAADKPKLCAAFE